MSRSLRSPPATALALSLVCPLGCYGDVDLEACTISETYCDQAENTGAVSSSVATGAATEAGRTVSVDVWVSASVEKEAP